MYTERCKAAVVGFWPDSMDEAMLHVPLGRKAWCVVADNVALKKIKQALREKGDDVTPTSVTIVDASANDPKPEAPFAGQRLS